ncbi:hypothetical protein [Granulicella sibirica]|nr:hypothetical protein [Granulicella sibirica]
MPAIAAAQTHTIHDAPDHLTFDVPTTWTIAAHDHELSTFHHEARTAPPNTRFRFVAAIAENPFPLSTFSGAHLYVSLIPKLDKVQCAAQVNPPPSLARTYVPQPEALSETVPVVGDRKANHGHDEHGTLCTEYRDDIYTLSVRNGCLRFDLAMNNFCGGEVSGVRDMTQDEILSVRHQMETILNSVHFDR